MVFMFTSALTCLAVKFTHLSVVGTVCFPVRHCLYEPMHIKIFMCISMMIYMAISVRIYIAIFMRIYRGISMRIYMAVSMRNCMNVSMRICLWAQYPQITFHTVFLAGTNIDSWQPNSWRDLKYKFPPATLSSGDFNERGQQCLEQI